MSLKATLVMGALPYPMNATMESMIGAERGKNYVGDTKDGMKHGEGKLFDDHGNLVYKGGWLNDEKSGIGKLYVNLQFGVPYDYEGEFQHDKRHGQGREYFPNGELHYNG